MTRQMADDEVLRPEVVAWQNRFKFENGQWSGWAQSLSARDMTVLIQHYADRGVEAEGRELITLASHAAAVAALQAERDALRAEVEMHRNDAARLNGCPWRVQKGLQSECQPPKNMRESLAALEALRGQVAGLADSHRIAADGWATLESGELRAMLYREFASDLDELLAIKERMG